MPADFIALLIVAIVGIGLGLFALHEAKKYRARMDANKNRSDTSH